MSILTRFKDIMSSNINAALDKAENPEKMVDQYLRNAKRDLAEVRKETAGVMAEEKRSKNRLDEINKEVLELTEFAKKALQAGNREDAEVFIAKKQKMETNLVEYQAIYSAAQINANHMRDMHNKLVADVENMENRKNIVKGKAAAARARETVNKSSSSISKRGSVADKMSSMEDKIDAKFNIAMAESELLTTPTDPASDLRDKYSSGSSHSVDDELRKMEEELGL